MFDPDTVDHAYLRDANIYLHTVLDEWFVRDVQPALTRKAEMVRFADDLVVLCESKYDAERFLAVLPKRFGRYGLTLHPDKTRMVSFQRPDHVVDDENGPGTFDFLGFTHHRAVSRKGNWIVKQRTARDRFSRALPTSRVVSLAPARPAEGAAPHADEEAEGALRLLRDHVELSSDLELLSSGKSHVVRGARAPLATTTVLGDE